jgi:hypothetical protein
MTKDTAYNIAREAKAKTKRDSGLSNCKLANLMVVKSKTDECDVESRVKIGDTSSAGGGCCRSRNNLEK